MNSIQILDMVHSILGLAMKFIPIAQQSGELTAEQEAEFRQRLEAILSARHMQIDPDPDND